MGRVNPLLVSLSVLLMPVLLLGCARATVTSLVAPTDRGVDAAKADVKLCERESTPGAGTYASALGLGMLVRVGAIPVGTIAAVAAPSESARTSPPQGGAPQSGSDAQGDARARAAIVAGLGTLAGVVLGPVVAVSAASDVVNEARQARFERCMIARGYTRTAAAAPAGKNAQKIIGVLHHGPMEKPLRDTISAALAGSDRVVSIGAADDEAGLEAVAAELLRQRPDVLVADGPAAVAALRQLSPSSSMVAVVPEFDPVELDLARENGRARGNLTAIASTGPRSEARCLEALKLALPGLSRVAILRGLDAGAGALWRPELRSTLDRLGIEAVWIVVPSGNGVEAFGRAREREPEALLLLAGAADARSREHIAALSAAQRLPAAMSAEDFVDVGGFMSCAANRLEVWRQAAGMVGSILTGQRAEDIPIAEPVSWTIAVNSGAARALGVQLRPDLLMRVQRVVNEPVTPER